MNGVDIIIGVTISLVFLLLVAVVSGIGYLLYLQQNKDEDFIIFKLPRPGEPLSKGILLIPMSKKDEFIAATSLETMSVEVEEPIRPGGYA